MTTAALEFIPLLQKPLLAQLEFGCLLLGLQGEALEVQLSLTHVAGSRMCVDTHSGKA